MSLIERIEERIIYENSLPQLRSLHGYFPGLVELPSGELIALFTLCEAFESVDRRVVLSRSHDHGRTWQFQGELFDKSEPNSDIPSPDNLKPTLLADGTLMAIGCGFYRPDPELPVGNPKTGGLLSGDSLVSFSKDSGARWSPPKVIKHKYPELIETSGPCIELASGDILATGCPFKMWDGSNPSGQLGTVLRSSDKGRTWSAENQFFCSPSKKVAAWESRVCELQPGRVAVIFWAFDLEANKHLPNHLVVSHDDGFTWSTPIDTGHMGQASNLMWLGGERLLTIHAHRAGDVGLYVRLVDLSGDKWNVLEETVIWGKARAQDTSKGIVEQFSELKFGQPSLLRLDNSDVLATHWCVESCVGKIRTHRLRVAL